MPISKMNNIARYLITGFITGLLFSTSAVANEPIVRVSVDKESAVPGTPIIMSISVLVPTWMPKPPQFDAFEIPNVLVQLPPDSTGSTGEQIDGETWSGVRRDYYIYPMLAKSITVPAIAIEITYANPATSKPITTSRRTPVIELQGVIPSAADDLSPFIAAESLELKQQIEGNTDSMKTGDIVKRTVVATITGSPPMFIPELMPRWSEDGIGIYPEQPLLVNKNVNGKTGGYRQESVTYITQEAGQFVAPAISLEWYDLSSGEIKKAELPAINLSASGTPVHVSKQFNWSSVITSLLVVTVLSILFAILMKRLVPAINAYRQEKHALFLKTEKYAYEKLTKAIKEKDIDNAIKSLRLWRSRLPAAAYKYTDSLLDNLLAVGEQRYGEKNIDETDKLWKELAATLTVARRKCFDQSKILKIEDNLPPLNPVA